MDIMKKLKELELLNNRQVSGIDTLVDILRKYANADDDSLHSGYSGSIILPEIKRIALYILPARKQTNPTFVLKALQ